MKNMIFNYVKNMKRDDVNNFLIKKNINLSEDELIFITNYIKENYEYIFDNKNTFTLERYKENFSNVNYQKLCELINEYRNFI